MAEFSRSCRFITLVYFILSALFLSSPVSASVSCPAGVLVRKNADIVFEGKVYSDRASLEARLIEFKARNPNCFVSVSSESGTQAATIERVADLLRRLGIKAVGFLTEPRNN